MTAAVFVAIEPIAYSVAEWQAIAIRKRLREHGVDVD